MAFGYKVYERENKIPGASMPRMAVVHPKSLGIVSTKELAEDIADRCTVHRSDVVAVLDALSLSAMSFITKGFAVRLGELGSFSTRIKCKAAPSKEEFKEDLIKSAHIRFTPSVEMKHKLATAGFRNVEDLTAPSKKPATSAPSPVPGSGGSEGEGEDSLTI